MAELSKESIPEIKNVDVDVYTAKGLFDIGYRYLDVRPCLVLANSRANEFWPTYINVTLTEEEFEKGHVDGALNIPYMFKAEEGRVKNPDFLPQVLEKCKKDDRLIVACNAGGRGRKATIDLQHDGFADASNIEGGYSAWVDAGFAGDKAEKVACKFRP